MTTYVITIAIFVAILAAVSAPAVLTARSHGRTGTMTRFAGAALLTGLAIGFFDARYQRAYDICVAEGRGQCEAIGFTGLQLLIIVGFLIASMVVTYRVFND